MGVVYSPRDKHIHQHYTKKHILFSRQRPVQSLSRLTQITCKSIIELKLSNQGNSKKQSVPLTMSLNENLSVEGIYDDEDEIDFSDLRAQYEVRLEEGLDTFVILDGLPKVPDDKKPSLIKFISRKLTSAGTIREDGFHMPVDQSGTTEGYVWL